MPTRVDDRLQRDLAVGYPSWTEAIEALGVRGWWLAARAVSGGLARDPPRDGWVANQVGRTPVAVAISLAATARAWGFQQVLPEVAVPTLLLNSWNRFATTGPRRQDVPALMTRSWDHRYEEVDDQFFMYHTTAAPVARDVLGFLRSVDEGGPGFVATALSTSGVEEQGART